jgi:hypothetical protein
MKMQFLVFIMLISAQVGVAAAPRTSKANALPGAIFEVKEEMKNVTPLGVSKFEFLAMYETPGGALGKGSKAFPGNRLEVLVKPKRYDGINCVKVRNLESGREGYMYWSDFYHSTRPVVNCDQQLSDAN